MHDLSSRIERLPFGSFHRQLLLMGGLGYTFDGLDAAVVSFVLPVLRPLWSLSSVQVGFLGSGTYIGYLFGALFAGLLGDRIGRRAVMVWALVLYCAASLVSAFAQDWTFFLGCRIVAGVGTGAESAIVAPFLAEFVAARYRGRFTGSLAGFFSFGFFGAALLGYFVIPAAPEAWRWVLVLTATPVIMLLWWRRALPESPRWLAGVGRTAETEAVVARMEDDARRAGHVLPAAVPVPATAMPPLGSVAGQLAALWRPGLARITAMSWIMWLSITFSYYAFFTWIPSLLVESGMTVTKSFGYSIAIFAAQIPGYFSAAWLNERIGRQATIASYMVLGGLSAVALAVSHSDGTVTAAGICLSFFMNGTYAGIYAYTPEIFPTAVRATGMGTASSIGRIGAIASPLLVGWLYPNFGFAGVFGTTTLVLLAGALAVMLMGVSTRNRSLEEITADELAPGSAAPARGTA
ncbi:MFS transporter [Lichenibacterium minor]|uniref:MFS transporter n=1 Tax=Lichenibacterium minor TaxID=2316528 RepID=A0A4Q2U4C6_9HYPH|nr:MFS transporter [Lichenibacterium minor]RYC29767.1 MFS transporter [Lichenibacterium minor]